MRRRVAAWLGVLADWIYDPQFEVTEREFDTMLAEATPVNVVGPPWAVYIDGKPAVWSERVHAFVRYDATTS